MIWCTCTCIIIIIIHNIISYYLIMGATHVPVVT